MRDVATSDLRDQPDGRLAGARRALARGVALGLALAAVGVGGTATAAELTPLGESLESHGFEVIKEARGVKVYKHRSAKIIRIAAEGVMPAPVAEVKDVLLDYRSQEGRVDRVSEVRLVRQSKGWLVVYQRLNLPVISDRDFTLVVRWSAKNGITRIVYDASSHLGPPPRDGIVRVTTHSGSWQLKPVDGGRATFVRFQVRIDLAGSLPRWMARAGAGKEIPTLFANLCRLIDPHVRSGACN
jgi:hypothetical protein